MSENNNMTGPENSENEFIMVEPEQGNSQPEMPQTETSQAEAPQTEVPQQEAPQGDARQEAPQMGTPQTGAPQQEAPRVEPQPQPQPMPSQGNVYRYQSVSAQQAQRQNQQKQKPPKGLTIPRVLVSAILFGVVAAGCFIGVQQMSNLFLSRNSHFQSQSNDIVNTEPSIPSTSSVTGAAVTNVTDVSGIVDKVMPSIVSITEKSTQTSYFGQTYSSQGAGSGFIVKQDDDRLLIATNNHVVEGADEITVTFNDNEVAEAKVIGTKASNDLAVIEVPLKDLKESTKKSIRVATLGNSDKAKVGQMVIAIGNALGYGQSVTVGYLSAKDRETTATDGKGKTITQTVLQTDAAINPGNSGGALIDMEGKVIGINSSKYFSYNSEAVDGIGYAIPMSKAVSIINDLMKREVLKDEEKGYLGITGRNITETVSKSYGIPVGVYVVALSETGAAYKGGVKQGDVITKVDDLSVKTIEEVQEKVNNTKTGTKMQITVMRSNDGEYKEKKIEVTLKGKDTIDDLPDSENSDEDPQTQVIPWGNGIY